MSGGLLTAHGRVDDALRGTRVQSPAPRDLWHRAVAADPLALPSQTPAWTDLTARALGGADASRSYEFPSGRRLVLPLVRRTVAGVGVSEESLPYGWGYGGPLADGGAPTPEEMQVVLADLARRPVLRSAMNVQPLAADAWSAAAPAGVTRLPFLSHVIDLDGGWDAVCGRYRRETRRGLRLTNRYPLEVREGVHDGLLPVFDLLNARSVDRWAAMRGQPLWLARQVERRRDRTARLRAVLEDPALPCFGWTAHLDGEPVAVTVALMTGESAWFWASAMDKELADRTRAGALLQSLAIQRACAEGMRWFHLGESDPGSGVARFKEGFGALPHRHEALRFERLPLTDAERRLRAAAGGLISRVNAHRSSRNGAQPGGEQPAGTPAASTQPAATPPAGELA